MFHNAKITIGHKYTLYTTIDSISLALDLSSRISVKVEGFSEYGIRESIRI